MLLLSELIDKPSIERLNNNFNTKFTEMMDELNSEAEREKTE